MANKTHLKIITPDGLFMDSDVSIVTIKTTEGNIGLQYGKSPFVASIEISEMHVNNDSKIKVAAIAGGLVYVTPTLVEIITDAIEWKEDIDINRAEKDKKEAEIALKNNKDIADILRNELALKRALNRISIKRS